MKPEGIDWPRVFVASAVVGVAGWGVWYFSRGNQRALTLGDKVAPGNKI